MQSTHIQALGQNILESRKALGLTQEELADLAGISYRPIYQIENGCSIRLDTLINILDALGLELRIKAKSSSFND